MSSLEQVVILAFLASTNAIFLMIPWAFGGSHWIGRFAQGSSEYSSYMRLYLIYKCTFLYSKSNGIKWPEAQRQLELP
jgi:hypothetical protein